MLVAVTGSTGLIGTALVRRLTGEGHQVLRLVRSRPQGPQQAHWDPAAGRIDAGALAGADAVVHLAGKSLGDNLRWTRRVRRELLQSRVEGTGLLAETIAGLDDGPRVLVCASGINYYGDRGDELLTEQSASGQGFLAEVCRRWEAAADPAIRAIIVTGSKSFCTSKGRLFSSSVETRNVSDVSSQVEPSGGDFATTAAPIDAEAPGRFSTITVAPRLCCKAGCRRRAMASEVPPAGNGLMIRTVPEGAV